MSTPRNQPSAVDSKESTLSRDGVNHRHQPEDVEWKASTHERMAAWGVVALQEMVASGPPAGGGARARPQAHPFEDGIARVVQNVLQKRASRTVSPLSYRSVFRLGWGRYVGGC